jgi:hypothetical protein
MQEETEDEIMAKAIEHGTKEHIYNIYKSRLYVSRI